MKTAIPPAAVADADPVPPRALIVMGVCGTGKSTVGAAVAAHFGWDYADADNFHPPENVAKMRKGIPLTDEDRAPWLTVLRRHLATTLDAGRGIVLACSALRARYRDVLRTDDPRVHLVHLTGARDLLAARMAARTDHYMPPSLLDSQLATLEPPMSNEALILDVADPPAMLEERIVDWLSSP